MSAYHKNLAIGFSLSVGIHLYGIGMWALIDSGLLPNPRLMLEFTLPKEPEPTKLPEFQKKAQPNPDELPRLVFVETDATREKIEPPQKTKYYSSNSSRAANPNPDQSKERDDPKLEGKEKRRMATEDVALPKPDAKIEESKPDLACRSFIPPWENPRQ